MTNKLKQANVQNWYNPKVAILDSSLISLFVLSFKVLHRIWVSWGGDSKKNYGKRLFTGDRVVKYW